MEERLLLAALISIGGILVYGGLRMAHRRRLSRKSPEFPRAWQLGTPGVLYFASRTCTPCREQSRVVERLNQRTNRALNLVKIDVDGEPDLASHWDVLTVPTTVVLDSGGRIQSVNHGTASQKKLLRQLEGVS
ncbi:hypothetical protein BH23ACT11_BH23ACT11_19140 [soil metagenome]